MFIHLYYHISFWILSIKPYIIRPEGTRSSHSGVILYTENSYNGFDDTKGIIRNRKSEEIIQWSREKSINGPQNMTQTTTDWTAPTILNIFFFVKIIIWQWIHLTCLIYFSGKEKLRGNQKPSIEELRTNNTMSKIKKTNGKWWCTKHYKEQTKLH